MSDVLICESRNPLPHPVPLSNLPFPFLFHSLMALEPSTKHLYKDPQGIKVFLK
jgi:hypothetical protein